MAGMRRIELADAFRLCGRIPAKYAALVALGVTSGCRISELTALRRSDLIDSKTGHLRSEISFLKLKARKKSKSVRIPIEQFLLLQRLSIVDHKTGKIRPDVACLKIKEKFASKSRKLSIPEKWASFVEAHLNAEAERGHTGADEFVFRGQHGNPLSRVSVYGYFRELLGPGHGTHWMRKTFAYEMFRHLLAESPGDPMRALELTRRAIGHERIDTTVRYLGIDESSISRAQNEVFNGVGGDDGTRQGT